MDMTLRMTLPLSPHMIQIKTIARNRIARKEIGMTGKGRRRVNMTGKMTGSGRLIRIIWPGLHKRWKRRTQSQEHT
jgi:hypothetical protein